MVTARKVEEPAHGVAASLQVLTGDALDRADLTRLYELQFDIPGLVVNNQGMFGAGFALRGVAAQGGTSLAVATHMNGAYLGNANLAITRLFDLDRVEVLKGPQGTLYGRNSTGGSINFITRPPGAEREAALEAAYGSYDTLRLEGHVNVPFDAGALRLAMVGSEGDGYIRNSVDGRRFAENDFYGARASLRVQPGERLQVDLMAQRVKDDGAAGELWSPSLDYLPDPADIRLTTVTLDDPALRTENDLVTANVEYRLDTATVSAVSAFARSDVRNRDDCAGMPFLAGCLRSMLPGKNRQWSQELRLASRDGAAVEWLLGLYYFTAEESSDYYFAAPLLNPRPINDFDSTTKETAYAAFGDTRISLGEKWRVSAGVRLGTEKVRTEDVGTGVRDNPTLTSASDRWSNTAWRLSLDYAVSQTALLYGSVATGFRSGGITTERLPSGEFQQFDPEHLLAYEAGIKVQPDRGAWRLSAAAFLYDFDDLQVTTTRFSGDRLISAVDNAARAEVYGLDAAATLAIGERLALDVGLVWTPKREFVEYRSVVTSEDLSGNLLSRAPEWSSSAAIRYAWPLARLGNLSASLQYNHRSRFYFSKENLDGQSQPGFGLWNLSLRLEAASGHWYVFASGRNLADQDYFNQALIQSSPGYPDTYEAGFGLRF